VTVPGPYDAIVLAGGRSTRMGDADKVVAVLGGRTLLALACDAVPDARRLVVVGPLDLPGLPPGALTVREDPPFAGPAAALGAGVDALGDNRCELVVVVAADVPRAAQVVPDLLIALERHPEADGVVPVSSDGHRQPLLAVYRVALLAQMLTAAAPLTDLSVTRIVRAMDLLELPMPNDVLADVDTPADLDRMITERHHG